MTIDAGSNSGLTKPTPSRVGIFLGGFIFLACLAGIAYAQWSSWQSDFAVVNVVTVILSILAWLSLTGVAWCSGLPRWMWRCLFATPLLALAGLFALFRVERVDGDLRPQFVPRYSESIDLQREFTLDSAPLDLSAARDTDFPQFLGPNRDGVIPAVAINPDWQTTPPEILWKRPVGDGWSGFAVQGDLAITLEQRGAEEWVVAYDANTGSPVWKYVMPGIHKNALGGTGPRSTPTIDGDFVFVSSAVSHFVCLRTADGTKIWSRELLQLGNTKQSEFEQNVSWARAGSPLVVGEQVVVPLGGLPSSAQALVSFNKANGVQLWTAGNDQISYSSPTLVTIEGVTQILYTSEKMLAAYAISPTGARKGALAVSGFARRIPDGKMLWSVEAPGNSNGDPNVSQPIYLGDGRILLTKGYGGGGKLFQVDRLDDLQIEDPTPGGTWRVAEVWSVPRVLKTKFTSVVIRDEYAYGLSDGILECVRWADGERQWKRGRYRQGQVLLAGEYLLITSEGGELVLVAADPSEFRELARIQVIGDVTWNTAALSGDRLLMRNSDEAACVKLPILGGSVSGTNESTGETE